jgi:hypothetical protein
MERRSPARPISVIPALAADGRVMPTGCGFWWALGWLKAVTDGSPGRFLDGRRGFEASGAVDPSGEWGPGEGARTTRPVQLQ